jgi:formylmethanofuran dehydrogenase subunit E
MDEELDDFTMQHNELSEQLLTIKVNDKVQVMFNVNDPIFSRRIAIDPEEYEELEEWSRCSSCGESNKKLKNCHFCGNLTCPNDINHQRGFPVDNPDRSRIST